MVEQQMYPTRRAAAAIAFAEYMAKGADMQEVLRRAEEIAIERRSSVLGFNHLMMACGVPWAARRPKPAQDGGRPASQAEGGSAEQS